MFKNRKDAGQKLAEKLEKYQKIKNGVVVAIPRGGVVTGYEISKKLSLPLEVVVTKKIGAPGNPEYAIGSINRHGDIFINEQLNISKDFFNIKKIINVMYGFGLYLIIPVLIIFVAYPKEIINLLFGVKYVGAYVALIILSFAYFINVLMFFNFQIMAGMGLVKKRTKILYVAAFINIVADLILIPLYGFVGAAIGTLLSILIMFILGYLLIKKKFSLNLDKNRLYKTIASGFLVFIIVSILKKIIITNIFIEAIIIGIIVISVYVWIGHYWGIVDFKETIRLIKDE